jgi:toxin ParE1/3/4
MSFSVVFSTQAEDDLVAIYDYVADRAGPLIALRFVESVEAYRLDFKHMPERGTRNAAR